MDEDFFDRLDKFLKFKGLNDHQITVQAGLSIGVIGRQRKTGRALAVANIAKILYAYPELNADWLITGRGEMLVTVATPAPEEKKEIVHEEMPTLRDIITDQRNEIASLNREVGALREQIANMERRYDSASFRQQNMDNRVVSSELISK